MNKSDLIWDIDIRGRIGAFEYDYQIKSYHSAIAVIGNNGSGKTTLLRVLAGLQRPSVGHIRIGNTLLYSEADNHFEACEDRLASYVPSNNSLFPHLTVFENLMFALQCRNVGGDLKTRVNAHLNQYKLGKLSDRFPPSLSTGEYQRVALIRSTLLTPAFYIFDEPMAALDVEHRATLRDLLSNLAATSTAPIVLSTHDDRDITENYGTIVVIGSGQVRLQLTSQEIATCTDLFVNEFFQHHAERGRT